MSKAVTTTHSSYWMDSNVWDNDSEQGNDINKIVRLAATRRAISNFVSILSGKNVPVHFYGQDSMTDGEVVYIAADDNPANFDVAVGLALHEASHILLSKFDWLRTMGMYIQYTESLSTPYTRFNGKLLEPANGATSQDVLFHPRVTQSMEKDMEKLAGENKYYSEMRTRHVVTTEYFKYIKTIMNVLEDRRIDQYVYKNAMGYRPYYTALYEKYFYTDEASKFIRLDPEARIPTVDNYVNHILFHIHPDSDPDALPGLKNIFEEMDLKNIHLVGPEYDPEIVPSEFTYEMTPVLWRKANTIMAMILEHVDSVACASESEDEEGDIIIVVNGEGDGIVVVDVDGEGDIEVQVEGQEPSGARPPQAPRNKKDAKLNPAKIKKAIEAARKVVDGEVKKKKITKLLAASITAMEEARGEMVEVEAIGLSNIKCMVTRDVSEALLNENWFIFSDGAGSYPVNGLVEAIAAGRRMGQVLLQRLQVRNDPVTTRTTRLPAGKIDRRLLAGLGMDNVEVFYQSRVDKHKPVMMHLTIDASGSMYGSKFNKSMTVATAMAYLSSKMDNVDCAISLRGGNAYPIVSVVFDSRRDQFRKWMKFAPHLRPTGSTPEGLCFAATMDIILENVNTHDVYFINFSDGEPIFTIHPNAQLTTSTMPARSMGYSDHIAHEHTRKMVQNMRDNGVKVLSYYINPSGQPGHYIRNIFTRMYGADAEFVDVSSVTNVLTTMNKLLLKR